jgi:hypothetical protein
MHLPAAVLFTGMSNKRQDTFSPTPRAEPMPSRVCRYRCNHLLAQFINQRYACLAFDSRSRSSCRTCMNIICVSKLKCGYLNRKLSLRCAQAGTQRAFERCWLTWRLRVLACKPILRDEGKECSMIHVTDSQHNMGPASTTHPEHRVSDETGAPVDVGYSPQRHKRSDYEADGTLPGKTAAALDHSWLPACKRLKNAVVRRTASADQALPCAGLASGDGLQCTACSGPIEEPTASHSCRPSQKRATTRPDTHKAAQAGKIADIDRSPARSNALTNPCATLPSSTFWKQSSNLSSFRTHSGNCISGSKCSQLLGNAVSAGSMQDGIAAGTCAELCHPVSSSSTLSACDALVPFKEEPKNVPMCGQLQEVGVRVSGGKSIEPLESGETIIPPNTLMDCQPQEKGHTLEKNRQRRKSSQTGAVSTSPSPGDQAQAGDSHNCSFCHDPSDTEVNVQLGQQTAPTSEGYGSGGQLQGQRQLCNMQECNMQEGKKVLGSTTAAKPTVPICGLMSNELDTCADGLRFSHEHSKQNATGSDTGMQRQETRVVDDNQNFACTDQHATSPDDSQLCCMANMDMAQLGPHKVKEGGSRGFACKKNVDDAPSLPKATEDFKASGAHGLGTKYTAC